VPALARYAPPLRIVDKPAYSAFSDLTVASLLVDLGIGTVVITGAETDVCVLSTVLSAVDLAFSVVIVQDGLCSSSDIGHDALMTMYRTRFHGQVDLVTAQNSPSAGAKSYTAAGSPCVSITARSMLRCAATSSGGVSAIPQLRKGLLGRRDVRDAAVVSR
jgi:hypothetical protein